MTALRKCRKCGLEAHTEEGLESFTKRNNLPYGRATICKKCQQNQEYSNPNVKENKKRSSVKLLYGITIEEYNNRMASSDCCQHCGAKENLCYDHDHNTMEFRGVLCRKCNSALGKLGDTLESIEKMYKYLGGVPL